MVSAPRQIVPFSGRTSQLWNGVVVALRQEPRLSDFDVLPGRVETARAFHILLQKRDGGGTIEVIGDRMTEGHASLCVSSGELFQEAADLISLLHDILARLGCRDIEVSLVDEDEVMSFVL